MIISLSSSNQMKCVFFEVQARFINISYMNFGLKSLKLTLGAHQGDRPTFSRGFFPKSEVARSYHRVVSNPGVCSGMPACLCTSLLHSASLNDLTTGDVLE